jgi:hypothetical protein
MSLRVEMDQPPCRWELEMTTSLRFTLMSAVGSHLPERAWRSRLLRRVMEGVAKTSLGLRWIRLSGKMPNGQYGVFAPRRLYPIVHLDGVDLGHTVWSRDTPRIGDMPVSAPGYYLGTQPKTTGDLTPNRDLA